MIRKSKAKQLLYARQYAARRRARLKAGLIPKPERKPQVKRPSALACGVAWLRSNVHVSNLPITCTTARIADRLPPIGGLSAEQRRTVAARFLKSIGGTRLGTPHVLKGGIEVGLWCVRLADLARVEAMRPRERILAAGEVPAVPEYPVQYVGTFPDGGDEPTWRLATPDDPGSLDPDPLNDSTGREPSPPVVQSGGPGCSTGPSAGNSASAPAQMVG